MADKYARRANIHATQCDAETWIHDNLLTLPVAREGFWAVEAGDRVAITATGTVAASTTEAAVQSLEHQQRGDVMGIILTGWRARFDGCERGGYYDDVRGRADGSLELISGADFLRTYVNRPRSEIANNAFFPLLYVRHLSMTNALHLFSHLLCKSPRPGFNPDDAIIAGMSVFQALVYQLAKPAGRIVTVQLLDVLRLAAQNITALTETDGDAQTILSRLRDDPEAQDSLQRASSGFFVVDRCHSASVCRLLRSA